jgi:hypothetical protein
MRRLTVGGMSSIDAAPGQVNYRIGVPDLTDEALIGVGLDVVIGDEARTPALSA